MTANEVVAHFALYRTVERQFEVAAEGATPSG
mgnify:FL=1